jgi:hypothetical protein
MSRRKVDAAAVVFALLVVATVAAFAYAQRVKRDPLLLDRVTIGKGSDVLVPEGRCAKRHIRVRFRTTTTNKGMVEIIRPGGEIVRVLAPHAFLKRYRFHTYHWDGKNDEGKVQPPGRYKLRVILEDEGRSLTTPGVIRLHKGKAPAGAATRCSKQAKKKGSG